MVRESHQRQKKLYLMSPWLTPSILSVTYWPSTQPSIGKKVHTVEDITLTCGRVDFGADATPTRSRLMSNNDITRCHSWSQLVGVRGSSRLWEPAPSRGLGPSGPLVEQPSRIRKKCCYSQRNLGSICYSLFSLQLPSHTQPFRNPFENKVWEVYFSKEVCSFFHYCWFCFRMYMYTYSCITAMQHKYESRVKDKRPPQHLVVVAIEKEALDRPWLRSPTLLLLLHLMLRLQSWSFGECRLPLCHYTQVYSNLDWWYLLESH